MTKYIVTATVWNEEVNGQIEAIVGEFTKYYNAKLFADSYNEHYKSDAKITGYCTA